MIDTPAMQFADFAIADPYPLVTDDAELWLDLLSKAHNKNRYLFGILTWVRTVGARLEATGNPAMPYKIVPIIATRDCPEGWASIEEWNIEKRNLGPFTKELIEVLKTL